MLNCALEGGTRSSRRTQQFNNSTGDTMNHPTAIRPEDLAVYDSQKMGKSTIFRSDRILVGLNAFEPGQEHKLHAHAGMDKVYHVLAGSGVFLLEGREIAMEAG